MPSSFLTRSGYKKLQEELDYLRTVKRQEVAVRLHEAIEGGELIEDAEYEAAKNEQAFVEGRIQELEILLANARIIEEDHAKMDVVQVAATVTIQEEDFPPETYQLVGPKEANPNNHRISYESPIGRALLGAKIGDTVQAETPNGQLVFKVLKIE